MKARSHKYPDNNGIYTDTTFYDKNDNYFDLGWQRLKRLDNYNEFSYLKNLFIDHNELTYLPDPSLLPHIEQLNCSYNNLTKIPFYPKLTFLNISNNKIISCIPYTNSRLKFFDLSFNEGLNIDFSLPNCKHLYITDNRISTINVGLFPSLEFLDCSNNQITKIDSIPTLIELNIQQNLLTELPPFTKLLRLMADFNQIKILKTYPNLLSVNIAHNLLTNIETQPNLNRIMASYNEIKYLDEMPKLELIDLAYNYITEYIIPPMASFVSLQFNPIQNIELDTKLLTVIKELSINYKTYTNIYKKYYDYFERVEIQVNRDKLIDLLSRLNKIFDEKLIESIFDKLSGLKFQEREEVLFKIALKLYWKYFSTNESITNITDLIKTEQFNLVLENFEKGLHGSCLGGHINIAKIMIDKGVKNYAFGLEKACAGGHLDIAQLMIDKGAKNWANAMNSACRSGQVKMVKLMINKTNNTNNTMINACFGNNLEIVKMIEKNGACNLESSFYEACENNNFEIVNFLIQKGARNWNRGLHGACAGGHISMAKLMIEKIESEISTLPPDLRDKKWVDNWNKGLEAACYGGNMSIVQLMIDKLECSHFTLTYVNQQLYVNQQPSGNWIYALQCACSAGNLPITKLMVEKVKNTDYHKRDCNWVRIFNQACSGGNLEIVRLIMEISTSEYYLNYGLEHALKNNNLEVINYLKKIISNLKSKHLIGLNSSYKVPKIRKLI